MSPAAWGRVGGLLGVLLVVALVAGIAAGYGEFIIISIAAGGLGWVAYFLGRDMAIELALRVSNRRWREEQDRRRYGNPS